MTGDSPDVCHSAIKHKDVHVSWGQSVHLPCKFNNFQVVQQQQQQQVHLQQLQSQQDTSQQQDLQMVAQPLHHQLPVQWYYHRRDNLLAAGFPVLQRRDKFILAADAGLVILNAAEPGWYQCRVGNQIIHSYNLMIDTSEYSSEWPFN